MKNSYFNSVTTLSKITAAVLFITLPMVTLFIGMEYQKNLMMSYYKTNSPVQSVCTVTAPLKTVSEDFGRSYFHARGKYTIQYPLSWNLDDFEHQSGEPVNAISSILIRNEQSKYNTYISIKVDRGTLATYKSDLRERGEIKETKNYTLHDATGTRAVIDDGNFDAISYLLERKGLVYDIRLNVLKDDPNKKHEIETLEKIFSTLEFNDFLPDNCKK